MISILDVGSGGGGMLRKIRKWARRAGRDPAAEFEKIKGILSDSGGPPRHPHSPEWLPLPPPFVLVGGHVV
jgi:hypothetical protein